MGRRLGSVSISSFVRLYMLSISFLLGVSLFMSRVQLRFYGALLQRPLPDAADHDWQHHVIAKEVQRAPSVPNLIHCKQVADTHICRESSR